MTNIMEKSVNKERLPQHCSTISEVRDEIDKIDKKILQLFASRLEYVEHIVNFKDSKEGIVAKQRQEQVFADRRAWALELGLDADLFEHLYKILIDFNVKKEMEMFDKKQNK